MTSLIFYGVGVIIGAGVYSVIGAAAGEAGYTLWVSFLIGAVVAGLSALSYAELASAIPTTGGEYVFLGRAFGEIKWAAYIVGVIITVNGAATAATVSLAFAGYFELFLSTPTIITAAALLVIMSALNIAGIKGSSIVNVILTSIEVAGLLLIIGAGVFTSRFAENAFQAPTMSTLAGAALIFFVYTGFEGIVNLTEEAREPRKSVPRALLICLLITTVLYVLVALATVGLASPDKLVESDSPLSTAVGTVSGTLSTAIGWIALFSTANTALIALIVTSRLLFSMSRNKDMPAALARTNKRQSPWAAAGIMLVLSLILIPFGDVAVVAKLAAFASLLAFISVNLCVIRLRFKEPRLERQFRVPIAVGKLPIIPIVSIAATLGLLTQFDSTTYLAGGAAIALGTIVYFLRPVWSLSKRGN